MRKQIRAIMLAATFVFSLTSVISASAAEQFETTEATEANETNEANEPDEIKETNELIEEDESSEAVLTVSDEDSDKAHDNPGQVVEEEKKNGVVIEGDTYYYYIDGVLQRWLITTPSGDRYYASSDGKLVRDRVIRFNDSKIGWIYFGTDGKARKWLITTPNGDRYYASSDGKLVRDRVIRFNDSKIGWIYFGTDGKARKWLITTPNGDRYYASSDGKLVRDRVIRFNDSKIGWLYFGDDAKAVKKKIITYGGNRYYATSVDGRIMRTKGTIILDGNRYYAKEGGVLARNEWIKIGDYWYYYQDSGIRALNRWVGQYFVDSGGKRITGYTSTSARKGEENVIWNDLLRQYKNNSKVSNLIFVKYTGGTNANVYLYHKNAGKWNCVVSCKGYVGKNGIDKVKAGDGKTPTGTYSLTGALGIKAKPDTKLPFTRITSNLYWCGDEHYYNQLVDVSKQPHSCRGEHLINYKGYYNYVITYDFNSSNTYKKGSALFFHCTANGSKKTAGCVAITESNLLKIMKYVNTGDKICIYHE